MFHRKATLGCLAALVAVCACQNPTTKTTGTDKDKDDPGPNTVSNRRTPVPTKDPNKPTPTPTQTPIRVDRPPTPDPTPTPSKTPVPPGVIDFVAITGTPNTTGKTSITGAVFNNEGVKFEKDAKIIYVKQGEPEKQVTIEGGKYTLADLTPGNYSITATEYGSTPRTQHVAVIKGVDYVLNFGEPGTTTQVYALYDKPEVTKVEPNQFNKDLVGDTVSFKLSLSEPMNATSIRTFVQNLRLAPMNKVAAGADVAPPALAPLLPAEDGPSDVKDAAFNWFVRFFEFIDPDPAEPDLTKRATFFTEKAGHTVELDQFITVTFPAPLLNGQESAQYQLFLVTDPASPITDLDTKLLGTDKAGKLDAQPAEAGMVLNNVFLSPYLGPDIFKKDTPESQWDSTHVNAVAITLKPDNTPPALASIGVVVDTIPKDVNGKEELADGTYIYAEYNEPVITLGPGGDGKVSRLSMTDLANYSFMVGINTDYLGKTTLLDGVVKPEQELAWDTKGFGTGGEEFKIKADPKVTVKIIAPKRVEIYIPNTEFFNPENAKAFSLRVAGVHDPANNMLPATQADTREAQPRVDIQYKKP
jgi:hypothetical protein